MKRLFLTALFAPSVVFAQPYPSPTFNSVVLQNPLSPSNGGTGATTSTGTGSAVLSNSPALTNPTISGGSISGLTTAVPVASGGTGANSASTALSNLGGAALSGATFTGATGMSATGPVFTLNDASGTTGSAVNFSRNGSLDWSINPVGNGDLIWRRFVSGGYAGDALTVSNATGQAAFGVRPTFNGATPWDSANLASPASLTGATFTGMSGLSYGSPVFIMNDTAGGGTPRYAFENAGTATWTMVSNGASSNQWELDRYVGGNFTDRPITVSNLTGQTSINDGLAVTGAVSGTGFSNYLAAPPAIGSTTPAPGSFSMLSSTTPTTSVIVAPNTPVNEFNNPGDTGHFADFSIAQYNPGPHTTTDNSPLNIASLVGGSGSNNPVSYDNGLTVSLIKKDWPTSTTGGGLNGLNIITRQGYDDSDAITVNTGGVQGFFSVMEGATNVFQATTGAVLQGMDVQIGGIETGRTGTPGANGYVANAATGALTNGVLVQSVPGASWTNAIAVGDNNGGPTTFTLTPSGLMTLGASGSQKSIRVQSNVLGVLNSAQNSQILALDDSGNLSASGTAAFANVNTANISSSGVITIGASGSQKTLEVLSNEFAMLSSDGSTQLLTIDDNGNVGTHGNLSTLNISTGGIAASGQSQFTNNTASTSTTTGALTVTGGLGVGGTVNAGSAAIGALSVSGLISPASAVGIKGTTAADNAQAGSDGEYVTNNTNSVALSSTVAANATSTTLTAGDWDVQCTGYYVPDSTTTTSILELGVSTTSATQPTGFSANSLLTVAMPAGAQQIITTPMQRVNVSSSTPVYCVATAGFATSTAAISGFIRARRIR